MDEFDVFLDAQSRKLTIKTLCHMATTALKHRQFIFITPQDISMIEETNEVKVHNLLPPERHLDAGGPTQQTLDFSQAS